MQVPGLRGLVKICSTCYMNSAIQALNNTKSFTDFILSESYKEDINKKHTVKIVTAYADLMKSLWTTDQCVRVILKQLSTNIL